ncbi:microfibril-associated glycoprotein 4-like [Alosa sapidissima]|uniref:microfibril-associated glycoprotein 4-like n=1 Tax=Alosa sapidissima TaxID=34773 RepID=UPI001C09CFF3|nr:microfibril-associated glycoprotein 4-like [Alosa sapidissima]
MFFSDQKLTSNMLCSFLALLLPLVVNSHPVGRSLLPLDCEDIYQNGSVHNGVYTIYPTTADKPVEVYCDMGCTEDENHKDGQWTVIQRRMDGTVNFYQPWDHYKEGFGNKNGEYWLGLETIFSLTWRGKYELRVDMEDWEGGSAYARYLSFSIDSEGDGYAIHLDGYINGGAGDSLYYANGWKFSTYDKDQDNRNSNCADDYDGGFWFNSCPYYANPNGLYKGKESVEYGTGINWTFWKGPYYSLKSIRMKIKKVALSEA